MAAVEVRNVSKAYGDVVALDDVSLGIEPGTTYGLLGTNGAGKTTLFSLLVGHQQPDSGDLRVAGADPGNGTAVRRRVGYLPETAGFPPSLTALEVLAFHAEVRGVAPAEREERIASVLETVGLVADADRRVGGYSKGMNRRLGLATALLGDPDVLLLDEPTAGLDPRGVEAFNDVVSSLATDDGMTILFSSHALAEVETLCDELAIMADGEVRASGTVAELRAAADDAVTVTATVADEAGRDGVVEELGALARVRRVTDEGGTGLRVRCDRDGAAQVVTAIHDAATVERFEVREPDLEAAFRAALGETVGGREATTATGEADGDQVATGGGDRP